MSIKIIILLILLVAFIIFFLYIEPRITKHKIISKNEYGSARFSTFKEIKRIFNKEKTSSIKEAGFPVWYSKDNKYIWFDRETPHYVYLGSTGSGKSVTAVIPTCTFLSNAKIKRSLFITDPKGEIYQTTSKMFKDNGYKIFTIDFRNPELSNKINLLEPIIKEYESYMQYDIEATQIENDVNYYSSIIESLKEDINLLKAQNIDIYEKEQELSQTVEKLNQLEPNLINLKNISMKHIAETNRLITSLSTMIMSDRFKEKDPFWNNSARNLLEGLIGLFLEEFKKGKIVRERITLTSIKKFQNSSMDDDNFAILQEYIDSKPYGLKSKDSLTSIFSSAENTYKSITATFAEKMALFDDVNVANITSSSDFDFDILGKKITAIYIIVPDEDKTYYSLITIIVGLLYRELVKLANNQKDKKLPIQIDWMLYEFANCPPLADIEAIVSVARSRGMRFQFFIQSLSQLDNVYGKEVAQIILDNCGLVYLKTNTQETAEAISKRLGKKTIESNSVSQSISNINYNGNRSIGLMGRDLLTPEEVKQLHYKTIIFPIIGYPIFRDTILYKNFSCYKKGELIRGIHLLEDLSHTYFTVEKLNNKIKKQKIKTEEASEESINNFYEDFKLEFKDIEKEITVLFNDQKYNVMYQFENSILYCQIVIDNIISGDDKERIENLNSDRFYIDIRLDNEKTYISIHKKTFY
ncbi:MAG: type IV secretory system conjugative DNA transfer family protein [Bacilli bacterium]|nr:type IV secretory system conjugative DNA transfer family protein [Bacilli bacterium]